MSEQQTIKQPGKISFLGYKCSKLEMDISEEYLNGSTPPVLKFEVGHIATKSNDSEKRFLLSIDLTITDEVKSTVINSIHLGLFEADEDITQEFLEGPFSNINAPAILYPFVRSFISTITINSGLEPILLPTINFVNKAKKKE
jgi:preprotein translocase subunit SecB